MHTHPLQHQALTAEIERLVESGKPGWRDVKHFHDMWHKVRSLA
jgi:hypothetical protein